MDSIILGAKHMHTLIWTNKYTQKKRKSIWEGEEKEKNKEKERYLTLKEKENKK